MYFWSQTQMLETMHKGYHYLMSGNSQGLTVR